MPAPPLDLPRIRRSLAGLDALALAHPELIDHGATGPANRAAWESALRTDEELNVSNDPTRTAPPWHAVRLPGALVDRAAALVPALEDDPKLGAGGTVSRASVLRLALAYGLERIEAECSKGGAP